MAMNLIHNQDEIPDEQYKKMLLTLMERQASREIAGAEVFGQCLIHAPTYEHKLQLVRLQREELKHFKLIADLLAEFGIDVPTLVRMGQRGESRFTGNAADLQVEDWIDGVLFNFMTDRAATFQLAEYANGSYLPLAKAIRIVVHDEGFHTQFGEHCLKELCREPNARREIQRRFSKWFAGAMRIFGRPGTPGNRYCIEVGLKSRDSAVIAADYLDSLRPILARCGLQFPRRDEIALDLPSEIDLTVCSETVSGIEAVAP
jgi:ring-1,2-phenylacetyl-CoA epoxidase subunit PaaA